ncbi:hypothetical protein [Nocardia terpenica]|uniref:Uncharacterized protein n=1 Tax=Nocardia terpenica TaxID=455432 RepID=A0A161XDE6_9NOCA|nr:hypothetical protein [Nocardia terpenica]KZM71328.1 hypothetical protein AWN90_00680 [Nocardia terpenica]NQE90472.1 hypothetical protein [Nocardia terpenica]
MTSGADGSAFERRTEVGGVWATWRVESPLRIAITALHDSDDTLVASFASGDQPDLAQARERWPRFAKLWDAVRHQFWSEIG